MQKTGGSTIHHLLTAHLPGRRFLERDISGRIILPEDGNLDDAVVSGHITAFQVGALGGAPKIITILREPVARLLSHFYFLKGYTREHLESYQSPLLNRVKQMSLREFSHDDEMRESFSDFYLRRLDPSHDLHSNRPAPPDLERALRFLATCDVVGIMPRLESFAREILRRAGVTQGVEIPFINRRKNIESQPGFEPVIPEEITPEIKARLDEWTARDKTLFEFARKIAP